MDMSAYITAPLELDKICRACLGIKGDMRPLFGACLDEMLLSFAAIEVRQDDGLPNLMCVQCVLQCSRAYTFKQLCEKSDAILKEYVKPEFQAQLNNAELMKEDEFVTNMKDDSQEALIEKNQLQEQTLQEMKLSEEVTFADNLSNVILPDSVTANFVTFNEEDGTIQVIATAEASDDKSMDFLKDEISNEMISEVKSGVEKLKYPCLKCDQAFALKIDLKVHLMTHPKDLSYVCEICNKAFSEQRILKRHLKIHLERKPHQCDQCDMSFAESSNLSKHKKKHTGELRNITGKPHLCSVCGRAFKWASSLSKHMKYHTGHKLLSCEYCGKKYVEARSLRIHIRSHTGERPYECDVCEKTFTQLCNLEKHLRVHTGEKPFVCPVCNKGFTQSGYVNIHMRTHTGARPYVCQTCGKAFAGSNTLVIHQRIHTGEKPYSCQYCGKSFSRHETLVIHTRTHTGDKPHVCEICNKGFTSSGHLSAHIRTHSGEKPHSCYICAKKFAGSSSLKVHMKSHKTLCIVCKFCNKSFPQEELENHLSSHAECPPIVNHWIKDELKLETVEVADLISNGTQVQLQAIIPASS